jgi:hypothetical protein
MTEAEIVLKFLARANPPPILFRYRPVSRWALSEIAEQKIYAARPNELNDPFECSAPIVWDLGLLRQQFIEEYAPENGISPDEAVRQFDSHSHLLTDELPQSTTELIRNNSGIICLSAVSNSIRMWSYYAQAHEGICVGYDTKIRPFKFAIEVRYQNPETPLEAVAALKQEATEIADHITLRKAKEWEFEREFRIPIASMGNSPRLIQFQATAITEIRFGARIKDEFRKKVMDAISHLPHRPKLIQMDCDFDRFILTETIV